MLRRNAETLQTVLQQILRNQHLDGPLSEMALIDKWPEIVGNALAAQTEKLYIKDRTLFLHVKSAIVRNELSLMRTQLIARLNEAVGRDVISNIVLR